MIEKIENKEQLSDWKENDIFTVRIFALLQSYGTAYNFASFYRQVVDGKITAVMSKLDGDFTMSLTDDYDRDELVRFFCVAGYTSILCDDRFEMSSRYEEGVVMSSSKKQDKPMQNAVIDEYPKLMDLFNFVDYDNQDFKSWYVDISHRVRHKTAKAYTLNVSGEIISSGILSSIYCGNAVLTAVRTADEFRNMGYGGSLVSHICSDVKGMVFLMRDKDLNESFYKNLGFENIGIWRMYR